jgi:toxin ParE1/3/4
MGRYTIRPLAWREIDQHLDYLEGEAGLATAERFFSQLLGSFEALAGMPKMGAPCGFRKPATRRLRRWPVKDFENWLIFYQPRRYGVEIVRVIHAARNIKALLDA